MHDNGHVKRALIFGVSGQDGAYLSQLLLKRGYEVVVEVTEVTIG